MPAPQPSDADACVRHTPAAMSIPRGEVQSSDRIDVVQVARNLRATQSVVESHRDEIVRTGVVASWEAVADHADLADALLIADARVAAPAAGTVKADLAAFTRLESVVVADARTQVRKEVFDAAEVRTMLRGRRSSRQRAKVVLQFAALYDALSPELRANSALSPDELSRAVAQARALLPRLKRASTSTHAALDARSPQRDLRDRMWTLVVRPPEMLGRLAGALWGMRVSTMIPKLKSSSARRARAKATTPATPSDSPTK